MYAYLPGGDSVDDITLPDIYTYKPFGGLIPLPDVVVYNHVKVHAWTGTEFPDNGGEQGETEPMVYVAASGKSGLQLSECFIKTNSRKFRKICIQ